MKLYNKLIAALLLVAGTSCTEIEDHPDGRITLDEVFANPKYTGGYLNACYGGLGRGHGHVYGSSSFLCAVTDDAHDVDDTSNGNMYKWNIGAATPFNNPLERFWDLYAFIRKCNVMLNRLETANIHSEVTREQYRGELHTLRAFYYLQLMRDYGAVPIVTDNVDDLTFDYSSIKACTASDVARQIIADCNDALDCEALPWRSGTNDRDAYRMNKAIACAVMSEAALFAASPLYSDGSFTWADAEKVTSKALTLCTSNGYSLFTTAPTHDGLSQAYNVYDYYFLQAYDIKGVADPETIMGHKGNYSIWNKHGLPVTEGQERAGSCPSQELVDSYETIDGIQPILGYADEDHLYPIINPEAKLYDPDDPYANRDPRLKATIYYNGARIKPNKATPVVSTGTNGNCAISATSPRNTRTGYYLKKFCSPDSRRGKANDGAVRSFRLAELYLNYAEAALEAAQGDNVPDAVANAVNEVRSRVGMPGLDASMGKEAFRERLRNERRVELAYEDNRFYDVRRWKILDQTGKVVTGMRPAHTGGYERFVVSRRNAYTDKFLLKPIPGDDAIRLIQHTNVDFQNPGWM